MFDAKLVKDIDFDKIILHDVTLGTSLEIIPSCGGILNAFHIVNDGKALNVIDGYDNAEDFKQHAESKGFKSCKLSPFACRINDAQYSFAGKKYTIEKFLLNGSALHGLLYDVAFTIKEQWADEKAAGVTLQYIYKGTDKGYPFHYTCTVVYELKKDNALTITTVVTNNDAKA
jgi:aldose 1-epimerase